MIQVNFDEQTIKEAETRYSFEKLKDSISEGKSNIIGAIGEIVVRDWYSKDHNVIDESTFNYDLIINGIKVDVKSKNTIYEPKPHYAIHIPAANIKQKCDVYLFVRINLERRIAYLTGWIPKDEFFEKATFIKKGTPGVSPNFVHKADSYNLEIQNLNKCQYLNQMTESLKKTS